MEILIAGTFLAGLILLDFLSLRYGVNSRDGRRETWW